MSNRATLAGGWPAEWRGFLGGWLRVDRGGAHIQPGTPAVTRSSLLATLGRVSRPALVRVLEPDHHHHIIVTITNHHSIHHSITMTCTITITMTIIIASIASSP